MSVNKEERLLAAMLDTSNEIGTFVDQSEAQPPVILSREETGASLTQHFPMDDAPDVIMLSRRQADGLAESLLSRLGPATLSDPSGDPPPVILSRVDSAASLTQHFPMDREPDIIMVATGQAKPLADAIRSWLREVS